MTAGRCSNCGRGQEATTGVNTEASTPPAGAVAICAYCARIGIFTGDGFTVRNPTNEEWQRIATNPQIARARAAVLTVRRQNARWN